MNWRTEKAVPEDVSRAFVNLKLDPNWMRILGWMQKAYEEEQHVVAVLRDDVDARWCQGRMQALEAILGANAIAEEKIGKAVNVSSFSKLGSR